MQVTVHCHCASSTPATATAERLALKTEQKKRLICTGSTRTQKAALKTQPKTFGHHVTNVHGETGRKSRPLYQQANSDLVVSDVR